MYDDEPLAYYMRREADERRSATLAHTLQIAKLHMRLAETYATIVAGYSPESNPIFKIKSDHDRRSFQKK